jgi:dihydroflavonol-4-reductase
MGAPVRLFRSGMDGSRTLVTGGSGFIGRHLVSALLARGHFVRIYDCAAPTEAPAGTEFVRGSVLDQAGLERALDGIDCVFHLAGIAHLWTPHPHDFDTVNRHGTEVVLAAAAEARVGRFVHCSTETVLLQRRGAGTLDETAGPGLDDMAGPYTRSKFLAERAALRAAQDGLPVVVVNPTLPIGGGDRDFTPPTAMMAHYLLRSSPFFLDCMLNLVDVRDVATGMVLAAERGRSGERYILGGENRSLRQIATTLGRIGGRSSLKLSVPAPIALATGWVSEWISDRVTRRVPIATAEGVRLALRSAPFDSRKARTELGYAPRPLQDAIADAAAWILGTSVPVRDGIAPDRRRSTGPIPIRRPAVASTNAPALGSGVARTRAANK